jgi:hypothetical protein
MKFASFVKEALAAPTKEIVGALRKQVELDQSVGLIEMQAKGTETLRGWLTAFEGFARENISHQYWDTENRCSAGYQEINLTANWSGVRARFTGVARVCGTAISLRREDGSTSLLSCNGSDPELKFALGKALGFDGSVFESQYRAYQAELAQRYERVFAARQVSEDIDQ